VSLIQRLVVYEEVRRVLAVFVAGASGGTGAKQKPQAARSALVSPSTRRAHAPCRGFLALRPARNFRAARCARRLTEVVRLRPAHGENATRTPLIDIKGGRGKTLTGERIFFCRSDFSRCDGTN